MSHTYKLNHSLDMHALCELSVYQGKIYQLSISRTLVKSV